MGCGDGIGGGEVRKVWGLGFGVWGLGFGVWDLGFGVWGLVFIVWCFVAWGWGLFFDDKQFEHIEPFELFEHFKHCLLIFYF